MKRWEFKEVLDRLGYDYKQEDGNIVVIYDGDVQLDTTDLIPGIIFKNNGLVSLLHHRDIPDGISFMNDGDVQLDRLEVLPPHTIFQNNEEVYLNTLRSIPKEIQFHNTGSVVMMKIVNHDYWIDGISNRALLNLMIKRGVFV